MRNHRRYSSLITHHSSLFALLPLLLGLASPLGTARTPLRVSPEESLRAVEAVAPAPRELAELVAQYSGLEARRVVNPTPPRYSVGRRDTFWIARQSPPEHFQAEAELRVVGRHAYWYVQRGSSLPEEGLRESAKVFDEKIYPQVRRLTGSEAFPGIDNDPRITLFNGNVPGVAGYVSSADSYPTTVHPHSNEREIIYVNARANQPGTPGYYATLAHEFTHLVHGNVHPSEDTWIREGVAQLVTALVFPSLGLPSGAFAVAPDLQLTAWSDAQGESPSLTAHYEAASWFLRYMLERFGEDALYPFLAQDTRGTASVNAFLAGRGLPLSFPGLFGEWGIANVVGKGGAEGVRPYGSRTPEAPRPRRLSIPAEVHDTVAQFGTDYYELAPATNLALQFAGAATVPLTGGASEASGTLWYGGRADGSLATMTRAFDLTGLSAASLSYRAWYDIEQEYDFAYVSVSLDGGQRWTLLETPRMSRANATGNNLGVGYTGRSGAGPQAQWIEESIDLSPYVGREVWVRFSYVTDDAFTGDGILLGDIRVETPGSTHQADGPGADWELRGWARVGPRLPQTWSVRIVEYEGDARRVVRVPIDSAGRGAWSAAGRRIDRAIIAVSATTPVTLQRGEYRLTVTQP